MSTFADDDSTTAYARARWEEGHARVERFTVDSERRIALEAVIDALVAELERRVGGSFDTMELVREGERAEPWCLALAHEVAPANPAAWDLDLIVGAAFHRYARRARDYQMQGAE